MHKSGLTLRKLKLLASKGGVADVARGPTAKECVSRNAADLEQDWEITICVLNVAVNF